MSKSRIIDLLQEYGPMTSNKLAQLLVSEYEISIDAARKQISRGFDGFFKLDFLPLPKNTKFVYLREQYRSPEYWDNLYSALMAENNVYGYAIASIKSRSGLIPLEHFFIACGSPIKQKKHISQEDVLKRLIKAELVTEKTLSNGNKYLYLSSCEDYITILEAELQARLLAENILLLAVEQWAKNLGLVSYDLVRKRGGDFIPTVGTFYWDLTAPSYLSALTSNKKDGSVSPGFLCIDMLLARRISLTDIKPWLNKVASTKSLSKIGKCIFIFLADEYDKDSFVEIKKAGAIPATTESLFGQNVSEGLKLIIPMLIKFISSCEIDPKQIDFIFDNLGKIEGAANNLRGALFEYLVAEIVREKYSPIEVRVNFKIPGGESDVVVITSSEIIFIECKGHQPYGHVDHEEVKKWLTKRNKTFYDYAKKHPDWYKKEVRCEFWTTGNFKEESIEILEKMKHQTKKYKISYLPQEKVVNAFKGSSNKELDRTFNSHFINVEFFKRMSLKKIQENKVHLP